MNENNSSKITILSLEPDTLRLHVGSKMQVDVVITLREVSVTDEIKNELLKLELIDHDYSVWSKSFSPGEIDPAGIRGAMKVYDKRTEEINREFDELFGDD